MKLTSTLRLSGVAGPIIATNGFVPIYCHGISSLPGLPCGAFIARKGLSPRELANFGVVRDEPGHTLRLSLVAGVLVSTTRALPWIVGAAVSLFVGASTINVVEGGPRRYLGWSPQEILGVPQNEATAADIARLNSLTMLYPSVLGAAFAAYTSPKHIEYNLGGKADFMQLFYACPCPADGDLDGEYLCYIPPIGSMNSLFSFLIHRIWGPGWWLGKSLRSGDVPCHNVFAPTRSPPASKLEALPPDAIRQRGFKHTVSDQSAFDDRESSTFDYGGGNGNGPLWGSLRDEVRKVNAELFVGVGYIRDFGGSLNWGPFVLEGPPMSKFLAS